MRGLVVLLVLLVAIAAGGYFTRPSHGLHRGVASALMAEGVVTRPDAGTGKWAFDDFYVATRSTMTSNGEPVLQCWGAFTRFLCTGSAPKLANPVAG